MLFLISFLPIDYFIWSLITNLNIKIFYGIYFWYLNTLSLVLAKLCWLEFLYSVIFSFSVLSGDTVDTILYILST